MALIYPLGLADFLDLYPAADVTIDCPVRTSGRNQASGANYTFEEAEPIWVGSVQFPPMRSTRATALAATLRGLEVPGRSFVFSHPRERGPAFDRGGAAFVAGVTLAAVDSAAHAVKFAGLPSGGMLAIGDRFSMLLPDGRRMMHEIQNAGATDGGDWFSVWPYLRSGVLAGQAVDFVRPSIKATIVPGTRAPGSDARGLVSGVGFSFMQNIR